MTRRGRVECVAALFFSGLDLDVQARLEQDDAFDLVPPGIASRRTFRLRAQQAPRASRLHRRDVADRSPLAAWLSATAFVANR